MVYGKVTQMDTSKLIYYYVYTFNERNKEEKAQMVLQVGDHIQRFSSMENYLIDSLALVFNNEPQDTKVLSIKNREIRYQLKYKNDVRWVLYTNVQDGNRSITDRVFMDNFLTLEKDETPVWQLEEDQKVIGGRLCSKATATLYGRDWVVWYSENDTRPDGPWLLKGLPGVVVEATDSTGKFVFQLYKIERRATPILFNQRNYLQASRNDVLKAMRRYYDNKAQYVSAAVVSEELTELPKTEAVPYSPLRKIIE